MTIKATLIDLRSQWQLARIRAARERLTVLLKTTPRYWQASPIGGGASLGFGRVTETQAIKSLTDSGHKIAYVDLDAAFIALEAPAGAVRQHS